MFVDIFTFEHDYKCTVLRKAEKYSVDSAFYNVINDAIQSMTAWHRIDIKTLIIFCKLLLVGFFNSWDTSRHNLNLCTICLDPLNFYKHSILYFFTVRIHIFLTTLRYFVKLRVPLNTRVCVCVCIELDDILESLV